MHDGYKVHIFLNGGLVANRRLDGLPRMGDTIRFMGGALGRVTEVIWCLDEEDDRGGTRCNIRTETIPT